MPDWCAHATGCGDGEYISQVVSDAIQSIGICINCPRIVQPGQRRTSKQKADYRDEILERHVKSHDSGQIKRCNDARSVAKPEPRQHLTCCLISQPPHAKWPRPTGTARLQTRLCHCGTEVARQEARGPSTHTHFPALSLLIPLGTFDQTEYTSRDTWLVRDAPGLAATCDAFLARCGQMGFILAVPYSNWRENGDMKCIFFHRL